MDVAGKKAIVLGGTSGIGLDLYVQDNEHRLPKCARLPSLNTNLPTLPATLQPYLGSNTVFRCPADQTLFPKEGTSYEWNIYLNEASYDRPQDWSLVTQGMVETIFGGRLNTPLVGDAEPVHGTAGKNALYFEGRVERSRIRW